MTKSANCAWTTRVRHLTDVDVLHSFAYFFGAGMSCPLSTERRAIVAVEIVFIPYFVRIFYIFVHRHPED